MGRPPKEKEEKVLSPSEIMGAELKANEEFHLNFVEPVEYTVSTGSIMFDEFTGGGLGPGCHRLIGPPESGKSSECLEIARNFLALHGERGLGLYVKAEGRLSPEMQRRSGLKFVFSAEEWVPGTILVLESHVYEFICNTIRKLIQAPNSPFLYCIIIDSTDGLILKGDIKKDFDENNKVAGTPAMTKRFLQSMGSEIGKRGHMCLITSQFSTNIAMDTYADVQNKRNAQGGGGWAAAHFANFALEFTTPTKSGLILEKEKEIPGPNNKILGKWIGVKFKKSTNEKTGYQIDYPVKYGIEGKSSVWTELELIDWLSMYNKITKKGAWYSFADSLRSELLAEGLELPEKVQGENAILELLEEKPAIVSFLVKKITNLKQALAAANQPKKSEVVIDS